MLNISLLVPLNLVVLLRTIGAWLVRGDILSGP